jgi:hypothetical protein
MLCPRCGASIRVLAIGSQQVEIDALPDQLRGQVFEAQPGAGVFLDGNLLGLVRAYGGPVYLRHGVTCRNPWNKKELRPA